MSLRKIWEKLRKIGKNREKLRKGQTLFLKCTCNNELIGSDSFVSDTLDGVTYKCTECERISVWNFDLFPVPVDITSGKYPSPREMGLC